MKTKKSSLLALLLLTLAGCDGNNGISSSQPEDGLPVPVGFNASVGDPAVSRSGALTTDNLTSMGVSAYYTKLSDWDATLHTPNFMYNQRVTRSSSAAPWTYAPVKFWPNIAGEKISFIAYAPHAKDMTGLTVSSGADEVGFPKLVYTPPADVTKQKDLLAAAPLMNRTKNASPLAFGMKHVLTRVVLNARSVDDIRITKIRMNNVAKKGTLEWNNSGEPEWTSITGSMNCDYVASIDFAGVADLTQIAEFFLLPLNATGDLEITLTYSGHSVTKSVAIPDTPTWKMGRTIAYTLEINAGTDIKLYVEEWDTNSTSGTMGENVPTSGYPFMKNGIIYESATKAYYVGPTAMYSGAWNNWGESKDENGNYEDSWYMWDPAIRLCRGYYSTSTYGQHEWRLPNKDELTKIVNLMGRGGGAEADHTVYYTSSYWSITDAGAGNGEAWMATGPYIERLGKTAGRRLICIRDVGTAITYPTVRTSADGFPVIYQSETKRYMKQKEWSGTDFVTFDKAKKYCDELETEGYTDWRVPTEEEATWLTNFEYTSSTFFASSGRAVVGTFRGIDRWNNASPTAEGRVVCVRDY